MNGMLYKTVKFKTPTYVGDPRIAVKIFNDKGADELVILDIRATIEGKRPDVRAIEEIASEAFMPVAYGGGVGCMDDASSLFSAGVEKVIVGSNAVEKPRLVRDLAERFGAQSIMVCIDVKRDVLGRARVSTHSASRSTKLGPAAFARQVQSLGAGEILLHSVDRDGTYKGYDLPLVREVSSSVDIPVVACGGAARIEDCAEAVKTGGASAAAAGSIFVFQGVHRAVLISFPAESTLNSLF